MSVQAKRSVSTCTSYVENKSRLIYEISPCTGTDFIKLIQELEKKPQSKSALTLTQTLA